IVTGVQTCALPFYGWWLSPFLKGGDYMTVFETLVLMIAFATLTVAILSEQKKYPPDECLARIMIWDGYSFHFKHVGCPLEGLSHTRPFHVICMSGHFFYVLILFYYYLFLRKNKML